MELESGGGGGGGLEEGGGIDFEGAGEGGGNGAAEAMAVGEGEGGGDAAQVVVEEGVGLEGVQEDEGGHVAVHARDGDDPLELGLVGGDEVLEEDVDAGGGADREPTNDVELGLDHGAGGGRGRARRG